MCSFKVLIDLYVFLFSEYCVLTNVSPPDITVMVDWALRINYLFTYLSVSICLSVCLSICLPASLPVWLSIYLSVCLPACLPVSIYLSVCLSVCLPACLSISISVSLPVCLSASLPVCLSVCQYLLMSLCLSVCLPACLPACLSSWIPCVQKWRSRLLIISPELSRTRLSWQLALDQNIAVYMLCLGLQLHLLPVHCRHPRRDAGDVCVMFSSCLESQGCRLNRFPSRISFLALLPKPIAVFVSCLFLLMVYSHDQFFFFFFF